MPKKLNPPREIERKFLLKRMPKGLTTYPHAAIEQGYLAIEPGIQVRLRRSGPTLCLAYKRALKNAREEREVRLSPAQFDALWPATVGRRLTKVRYNVPYENVVVEVDVYTGRHKGIVVAEVEFPDQTSCRKFVPPDWCGKDVTGNSRYSNVLMAQQYS